MFQVKGMAEKDSTVPHLRLPSVKSRASPRAETPKGMVSAKP